MAARKRTNKAPSVVSSSSSKKDAVVNKNDEKKKQQRGKFDKQVVEQTKQELKAQHFSPVPLVFIVMLCSGFLWLLAFRDLMSTGKVILGSMDEAMLQFTKSFAWYDESRGWKSKMGGLSSIDSATTDANNMGGLFIRKMGGAAALAVHSQKLMPLVFHPNEAHFGLGHFNPMLITGALGNLAIAAVHYTYIGDITSAGAGPLLRFELAALVIEAIVLLAYAFSASRKAREALKGEHVKKPIEGKTKNSIVSRITMRTITIVSGLITAIAGRDLLFPGTVFAHIPRDDIYLEWTNAFIHSPPNDSPEADEHSFEAPLFVGDKYVAQLLAVQLLVFTMYKFATAYFIRYGTNHSGEIKCRLIWRSNFFGNALILFLFRLFAAASKSAGLDLRWHLMCICYETVIIGLQAFF